MQLKEPAKCCGSPTLLWITDKRYFMCPCGEMKINEMGKPIKARTSFNHFFKRKGDAS
jgi:hypothetical protein